MCVESDGCEIEGCSSSDEVRTLSGSMSPGLKPSPDLHSCKPGQKFRAALRRYRTPAVAAGILSFGNVLNYMDRSTVAAPLDIHIYFNTTRERLCVVKVRLSASPDPRGSAQTADMCDEGMETADCAIRVCIHGNPRSEYRSTEHQAPVEDPQKDRLKLWLNQAEDSEIGVLLDIQRHFEVTDSGAGLLQTVFICSFMVAAPIFGYLGDRFNRKIILSCGIFFWSTVTLLSSFIGKEYYWLFVLSRGLVGIGESSYSAISSTIIGDLYTSNSRTMMLSVFYLAIPLGSGLGYILGSGAKDAAEDWHWALRVSPVLGITVGTLILLFVPDPKRGSADQMEGHIHHSQSWLSDMKALAKNRSYVFSSLATSAVSFATGAFGMLIPIYLFRAQVVQKEVEACTKKVCSSRDSLIFGAITCVTGLLGLVIGAVATRFFRRKTGRADPLVCAVSMLGSAIFICLIFVVAKNSIVGAYVCIFIGETLLFVNWALTADILMFVIIPTRRATAVAFQSFTSHLLGDAGSPYLIGKISDKLQERFASSELWKFLSLGYALMLCPFIIVLGGMFFLATALYFLDDREKAEKELQILKIDWQGQPIVTLTSDESVSSSSSYDSSTTISSYTSETASYESVSSSSCCNSSLTPPSCPSKKASYESVSSSSCCNSSTTLSSYTSKKASHESVSSSSCCNSSLTLPYCPSETASHESVSSSSCCNSSLTPPSCPSKKG
ncbi:protein spinster homolog 2 isoform X6 [Gambusia affinis]|uniref:protein spinster homolog 2 isoform X6 n=1 Tax=Gambusia affinis TaxID=33528 RepID=UPI001CDD3F0E|nr:protein spinster homolog 2 isoform X6 [Gambusia affinis]